jgi:hypothetical protein
VKTKKEIKNVISVEIGSIFREKVGIREFTISLFFFCEEKFCYNSHFTFFLLNYRYRCPRLRKKLHNLFVIKDINFYIFLDDSYASTAIRKILRYIQGVSAKILSLSVICQRIFMKFKMQLF